MDDQVFTKRCEQHLSFLCIICILRHNCRFRLTNIFVSWKEESVNKVLVGVTKRRHTWCYVLRYCNDLMLHSSFRANELKNDTCCLKIAFCNAYHEYHDTRNAYHDTRNAYHDTRMHIMRITIPAMRITIPAMRITIPAMRIMRVTYGVCHAGLCNELQKFLNQVCCSALLTKSDIKEGFTAGYA